MPDLKYAEAIFKPIIHQEKTCQNHHKQYAPCPRCLRLPMSQPSNPGFSSREPRQPIITAPMATRGRGWREVVCTERNNVQKSIFFENRTFLHAYFFLYRIMSFGTEGQFDTPKKAGGLPTIGDARQPKCGINQHQ